MEGIIEGENGISSYFIKVIWGIEEEEINLLS